MASLRLGRHCATARLAESPSRTAISPVPWTIETHLSRAIELLDSYSTVFSYRKVSGLSQHGSCVSHICKHIRTREDRLQPRVFRDNFRIANRTGWPTLRSLTTPDRGGPPNWRRQFVEQ